MSPSEADPTSSSSSSRGARARANTTSFAPFWRKKGPNEHGPSPHSSSSQQHQQQQQPQHPLSLDELIRALSPPSVPSLAHARSLASMLAVCSPLPRREVLNPILDSLCNGAKSPPSVQAAGFDILSAYCENHEALPCGVAEKLAYFSLFLGGSEGAGAGAQWAMELWEPRFKALRALTNHGQDVLGIVNNVIDLLQSWIEGAFEGLLRAYASSSSSSASPSASVGTERAEMAERERSIDILVKFLGEILTRPDNISRITEERMAGVLKFYASLVDRAIALPDPSKDPPTPNPAAISPSISVSRTGGHRRNISSLSSSSSPSIASTPPVQQPPVRHPAEFATTLYMNHLSAHIKSMPPTYLNAILPLLFRALAFCASPLPRLSVMLQTRKKNTLEDKITETLNALFSGPYATVCMRILRIHLFPPQTHLSPASRQAAYAQPAVIRAAIMASLGATRTFRNYVRRALSARLARAYISREASIGYSHSGAPGHMELQVDLMEKAWPKEDYTSSSIGIGTGGNGWDAARLGRVLADAVGAWVEWSFDDAATGSDAERRALWEKESEGRDEILEEAAGVLKDILQELDLQDEDNSSMDEEEAAAVGLTLLKLSNYVLPLKNPDGTPFTIPISAPSSAPTPLLRTLSSLLSSTHSRLLSPLLATILIHVAPHLTDTDTARLPALMAEQGLLAPTEPAWVDNWGKLVGSSVLMGEGRRETRRAVVGGLREVYASVRDMGGYRRRLGDLVWRFCGGGDATGGMQRPSELSDDADAMWKMLGTEVVLRSVEQAEREAEAEGHGQGEPEDPEEGSSEVPVSKMLDLLLSAALESPSPSAEYDDPTPTTSLDTETSSLYTLDTHTASHSPTAMPSHSPTAMPSLSPVSGLSAVSAVSPTVAPVHSDLPSVMSILSSLATGTAPSRSQSSVPQMREESREREREILGAATTATPGTGSGTETGTPSRPTPSSATRIPRDVSATSALIEAFTQLTFTPLALSLAPSSLAPSSLAPSSLAPSPSSLASSPHLSALIYTHLLTIAAKARSLRARLTALQFLVRLRADRDHRVYYVSEGYDPNGLVGYLGALVNRVVGSEGAKGAGVDKVVEDVVVPVPVLDDGGVRRTRPRMPMPQERNGRQASRGRGAGAPGAAGAGVGSRSEPSRSRSRAPPLHRPPVPSKPLEALWQIPETLAFNIASADSHGEVLVSYDPEGPDRPGVVLLPVSQYLQLLTSLIEKEASWEILSYVLCHLPVQLANKHLFCGPKSRAAISRLMTALCTGIITGELASAVEAWPPGLKARDAHGLAYQTLSVLVSYKRCFDLQQRHLLVEVFNSGLNDQLTTTKCCLHALTLCAFELKPSMTKCLSRILEKLSQIMSNPNMAVHIVGFLSIIGGVPELRVNFTEGDYKMVFGVALQYLQHYNRQSANMSANTAPTSGGGGGGGGGMSWALSQHVRILSYSVVYNWFLAVKLPDRPRHIRYITRQLLLANEGNTAVDAPTEVCFDWLARYTYASADPRPAHSVFSEIVLHPSAADAQSAIRETEKTWVMGNSIVTIRALPRSGWVEVMSRRPSGFSRFVCRVENVPMVGPGDVGPDLFSIPAGLIMERDPPRVGATVEGEPVEVDEDSLARIQALSDVGEDEEGVPRPDPIKGYVWSKTAPSQRRKHVDIDPSFLILQLSPFPDGTTEPFIKRVHDPSTVPKFVASLDRIPVIDTHKVGILYVAPNQTHETDILQNAHGSPAYTRFLEGLGRLINLRGQVDVYAGGLDPDEDGEYAYAWWDDIGQILYHTATMMPTDVAADPLCNNKKRHIGNDYVRIVWNDSGRAYRFDTLKTQFQFVNIVIEPHSLGTIAAFSNNLHENEYFKVLMQLGPGMTEFAPVGNFKLISAENLPLLVRQLSLLSDWFASIFRETQMDTARVEMKTNWHSRLEAIRRFKNQLPQELEREEALVDAAAEGGVMGQEALRDFTTSF